MKKEKEENKMNKQILAAFAILIFALSITGYAYTTWQDNVKIQGTAEMAKFGIYIQDYNITLTTLTPEMQPDNHTLKLTGNITPDQTNWTGIIIKNNGTTPATITYEITTNNQSIWETYFTHNEYFYGPHETIPPEVWESATTMPPTGSLPTPPELPAQNMLVVWQNITLNSSSPAFTIEITVTYTATWQGWTDTVSIIYILTYQQGES
jgi:hypothetical protein